MQLNFSAPKGTVSQIKKLQQDGQSLSSLILNLVNLGLEEYCPPIVRRPSSIRPSYRARRK